MLLYTIYTPDKITSWNRERIYAFASIECFVLAMRYINENGGDRGVLAGGSGILRPVNREEAMDISSMATLVVDSATFDGPTVLISENGVRDSWDGSWKEVKLAETTSDEYVPGQSSYA